ncbi:MAG: glycosyltransferase [Beutenbergiaceae bacterium]
MTRPDIAILTSGHNVADARLHREVRALQRRGLTVEVLGLGDAADGPDGALVRTWPRGNPVSRAWLAAMLPWRTQARVMVTLDPDITMTAWLRRALSPRRRLVADVHEDYLALLKDRAWARGLVGAIAGLWARLGAWAATRATVTVVADTHLLPQAPKRLVLTNSPDLTLVPDPSELAEVPRALYIGDIRASRGLDAMLAAVAAAPRWHLDLVGRVSTAQGRALLDDVAKDPALQGRVHSYGHLPPERAWQHAQGAWVGLMLLDDTPAFRAAVPSKLSEYTAAGLAVIATPLPRVVERLNAWGNGVICSDPQQVAASLRELAADPAQLQRLRAAARAWRASCPVEAPDLADFATRVQELAR